MPLQRLRDDARDLGLGVHPVPGQPQGLGKVQLEQAMVADHLERGLRPCSVSERRGMGGAAQVELVELRIIADAEPAVTPRRSASALVTGSPLRDSSI